ncbi:peptidylprolyl isomerase [Brevundimonas sp. UBA2416]|uniref:peptidylprolyl isomerase n=1 Tax=Brevundimonas sp. UBA2416 TaxID=1946124 RepID=UPI0025BF6AFD|nr:peptidylprolyl isomerase [Brevundimonas sp. UBA2416]HRD47096.1 peptidylprolyl isomerase [Caulobacter sp.]
MKHHRRQVLGGLAGLPLVAAATSALGQTPPPPIPPAPGPRIRFETAQGAFVIEVYPDRAPLTAGSFLRYVDESRLEGAHFYRAISFAGMPDVGLLQGGLNGKGKRMLPPVAHESTKQTGLTHKNGAVSLAREGPGSATCEFFVCLGDMSNGLDADPRQPGDNLGYAVFGQVVEGMEVIKALHRAPVSPTKGAEYGMAGQMLDPTLPITSIARAT